MQQAKLMDMSELSKLIGQIGRQKVQLQESIQHAAIQCVAQSIVHRNVTPAIELFNNCEGALRRDSLVAFFERYGNIAYMSKAKKDEPKLAFYEVKIGAAHAAMRAVDDDGKCDFKVGDKLGWTDNYELVVKAADWTKAKKEAEIKSEHDLFAEAQKFIARIGKLAADTQANVKGRGLVDVLYKAYITYQAEEVLKASKAMSPEEQQGAVAVALDKAAGVGITKAA